MANISTNNNRIAQNTLFLYFRMGITLLVSLYTSRVVLKTLGVEDYGIYNVVGGVVTMFGFINGAMSSATSRYITYSLGKNNKRNLHKIFCTCINIHIFIALVIFLFAESIGLWYINNKIVLPLEREIAAMWVYQCSILSTIIMIISVPYNACIIAHEKMTAFAYISVFEVSLKLFIVYLLPFFPIDKLTLYAILILLIQILIRLTYTRYCKKHFEETHYTFYWNYKLIKEMTSFASWSLIGSLSAVAYTTGLNLLLNLFFGPVVNAARAISVQVQNAVNQFVTNFQTALNPQITKSYANNDFVYMYSLVFRSARFSFYLLMIITIPIQVEANTILAIWLEKVPDNTTIFMQIMLCTGLVYTLSNPLIILAQATGKIRKYQITAGGVLLMIVPVSYLFLRLGMPPYSVFIIHLSFETINLFVRLKLLHGMINLSINNYIKEVIFNIIPVIIISYIPPIALHLFIPHSLLNSIIICITSVLISSATIYFVGLNKNEKNFIINKTHAIYLKYKH